MWLGCVGCCASAEKGATVIFRASVGEPEIAQRFAQALTKVLTPASSQPVLWLCIGTDTAVGDCLGPLVGTLISERMPDLKVIGTLDQPLHAGNITARIEELRYFHPTPFTVAIDASLGKPAHVGCVTIRQGALWPGAGLRRRLPPVGQVAITGVIGTHFSWNEEHILHRTRLSLVWKMACTIVEGIQVLYAGQKK